MVFGIFRNKRQRTPVVPAVQSAVQPAICSSTEQDQLEPTQAQKEEEAKKRIRERIEETKSKKQLLFGPTYLHRDLCVFYDKIGKPNLASALRGHRSQLTLNQDKSHPQKIIDGIDWSISYLTQKLFPEEYKTMKEIQGEIELKVKERERELSQLGIQFRYGAYNLIDDRDRASWIVEQSVEGGIRNPRNKAYGCALSKETLERLISEVVERHDPAITELCSKRYEIEKQILEFYGLGVKSCNHPRQLKKHEYKALHRAYRILSKQKGES
ncbi:MAG: hypothetical protein WC796_03155 [Candidatus Pacearchaeota archaeon]|jgi:hypothetical protein